MRVLAEQRPPAGTPTSLNFRGMEQSSAQVQRNMLSAWQSALDRDDTFSRSLSPERVWLTALHDYVAQSAPAAANADGTVASDRFYELLGGFLDDEVRKRCDVLHLRHNLRALHASGIRMRMLQLRVWYQATDRSKHFSNETRS